MSDPDPNASAGGGAGLGRPSPGTLAPDPLEERVVASRILHRGHYLTFRIDTIERLDGSRAERDVCGHPGAVAILALDDEDRVLMVRQWRSAAGRAMLEIPAGTLNVLEAEGGTVEDHALAARRELEEETGYRAGRWRLVGSFWTAPGFAEELMHLYLATELRVADDRLSPDEDERLELERLPWRAAVEAATNGVVVDAKSILGLLWLERLKARGEA